MHQIDPRYFRTPAVTVIDMRRKEKGGMKVLSVDGPYVSWVVETDREEWPTYRRGSGGGWERLIGDSWEEVCFPEDVEEAYQAYISDGNEGSK